MIFGNSVASTVSLSDLQRLFDGELADPGVLLGPQPCLQAPAQWSHVRTFLPEANAAWLQHLSDPIQIPMKRVHPAGLFEGLCPAEWNVQGRASTSSYRIGYSHMSGETKVSMDSYAVAPMATDFDQYLIGEGKHLRLYDLLGAHRRTVEGVVGTNFAVWAPNARGISVVGDFNSWDYRRHPLRKTPGGAGIWEIFIPSVAAGAFYKFRVTGADGHVTERTDPMGFSAEMPPKTASIVVDLETYTWNDQDWITRRATSNALQQPMSVYEVHLGSWQTDPALPNGWLNYRELAHRLVKYCQEMNYTHLELLPISEHPYTGSWGYQTTGYFSVTSRYGSPEDFMYFVDHCHQHGIGVIIDWVPAHFPKDRHGLAWFDGTALYEHLDPRQGEHPDWGTLIFNYGRNEVRNFLIANALFWLDKYHIDGLRVDAVASMLYLDYSREANQWVPNRHGGRENLEAISLLREFNQVAHAEYPGVLTIAEESTAWEGVSRPVDVGGLGFSLKWNMGWMNDTTRYFRHNPIHRKFHHNELTFSLIYAFHENFTLPLSHDEVVHGKRSLLDQMPGDLWQKFANLRLLYTYMWMHPGKKLLFMGSDFGQWTEWNHNRELDWGLLRFDTHGGLKHLVSDLNRLHIQEPALHELDFDGAGFQWIDCLNAENSILAFLRRNKAGDQTVLAAFNMTPVVRRDYRLGVDGPGIYREILNSDSKFYGGSNVGTLQSIAEPIPAQGRPWSIPLNLPPLAGIALKQVANEPR
jgi:1,4-alpha-glucan branching enzyme